MDTYALVAAALACVCGWVHYSGEFKTNSGANKSRVAAVGAYSCGRHWDYVPGRLPQSQQAGNNRGKAILLFSGFKVPHISKTLGLNSDVPVDVELRQPKAGQLWTMFTAAKTILEPFRHLWLVGKVFEDISKAKQIGTDTEALWRQKPPPDPEDNELDWIEWSKQITTFADAVKPTDSHYHKPLDAEMKWLHTMLFDAGVQDNIKGCMSRLPQPHDLVLHLFVTHEPCDFCLAMIVAHHSKLQDRFAAKSLLVRVIAQAEYHGSTAFAQLPESDRKLVEVVPYWCFAGASLPSVPE